MERQAPRHARAAQQGGVEGNARLTTSVAAVIFVLLAIEGVTILSLGNLLYWHEFVGIVLIPLVLVKIVTTTWRFAQYYLHNPEYRRKGPPLTVLRLLGPIVIVLTIVLLASGVGLVLLPVAQRPLLSTIHRASFILWIAVMTIHVLGHLFETAKLSLLDWIPRTRRDVARASWRQWALVWSVVIGVLLAADLAQHSIHL